jgi:hypothetical protein
MGEKPGCLAEVVCHQPECLRDWRSFQPCLLSRPLPNYRAQLPIQLVRCSLIERLRDSKIAKNRLQLPFISTGGVYRYSAGRQSCHSKNHRLADKGWASTSTEPGEAEFRQGCALQAHNLKAAGSNPTQDLNLRIPVETEEPDPISNGRIRKRRVHGTSIPPWAPGFNS